MKSEESLNMTFDENPPPSKTSPLVDDDLDEEEAIRNQTALAISTTEAKYESARKACQQALWMKQALIDYDIRLDDVLIMFSFKKKLEWMGWDLHCILGPDEFLQYHTNHLCDFDRLCIDTVSG
ncbi:hypothetical protein Tco_1136180 [Tanacetum coccineum]